MSEDIANGLAKELLQLLLDLGIIEKDDWSEDLEARVTEFEREHLASLGNAKTQVNKPDK